MVDLDRIDYGELSMIKLSRALTDPIMVDRRGTGNGYGPDSAVVADIRQARMLQNMETDVDVPIKRATWPETCSVFSSLSLAVPLTADATDMYMWAFYKYLTGVRGLDEDELPEPAASAEPPDEHLREKLESLRKQIKVDRDTWFIENAYDPEWSVPKAFWTEWHSGGAFDYDDVDYEASPLGAFDE